MRYLTIIFLVVFGLVQCDLNSLLATLDESSSSSEEVEALTPLPPILNKTRSVHNLKFVHCTFCSRYAKNAIIIAQAIIKENPEGYFNVSFEAKKGKMI